MGRHERGAIQELEESVAGLLTGEPSRLGQDHTWEGHDLVFASAIEQDFPDIREARASGNTYASAGDVEIVTGDGTTAVVELKASASSSGRGTAANISQNALTDYGLFPDAISWSDWRESENYPARLTEILNRHPGAAEESSIEAKGRLVRDAAKNGDELAGTVVADAKALAHQDRRGYLATLAKENPDPAAIRMFSLAIIMGAHTSAEIRALQERGLPSTPDEVGDFYGVYFTNVDSGSIVMARFGRDAIGRLLTVEDFQIELGGDDRATCFVLGSVEGEEREVLRFILHWKNVFLGIKTPCINVFLGSFPLELIE